MQEREKLTMVKAQTYLKARKAKKSVMLDDFCESTGYCRRHAARVLHQAGQRYLLGEEMLRADPAKHLRRHRPSRYGPAVQQALITIWSASTFLGPVRLAGGMPLFVENQKGTWASPSGGRDPATPPPDKSCHHRETPGRREADVSSARALSYPEYPSGWQDPRADLHGPSAGYSWRPSRGPGRSRWRTGDGRLQLDTDCY
jgi:hypothetical protein